MGQAARLSHLQQKESCVAAFHGTVFRVPASDVESRRESTACRKMHSKKCLKTPSRTVMATSGIKRLVFHHFMSSLSSSAFWEHIDVGGYL